MIIRKLVVGPLASNCYIVGSESTHEGMIIDPADEVENILKTVQTLGLKIKVIVLTHGHPDHVGALKPVKEATGAEVAAHSDDAEWIQNQPLSMVFGPAYPTPDAPDRLLHGGDVIDIGDLSFSIIHTPGHSPGGICLLGQGVLFSGDTLFNSGIGRYDLPGGDYDRLIDSLQAKLMPLPAETIVHPGHGPETTIGTERQSNPFLRG